MRLLVVLVPFLVLFWIVSIVDCALQPPERARGVSKTAWLLIAILLPVIGGILWFAIGRGRRGTAGGARRAPDDDPDFLSTLGSRSDQDERIRRLEEELARLDADYPLPDPREEEDDPDDEGPRRPSRGTAD